MPVRINAEKENLFHPKQQNRQALELESREKEGSTYIYIYINPIINVFKEKYTARLVPPRPRPRPFNKLPLLKKRQREERREEQGERVWLIVTRVGREYLSLCLCDAEELACVEVSGGKDNERWRFYRPRLVIRLPLATVYALLLVKSIGGVKCKRSGHRRLDIARTITGRFD